MKKLKRVVSFLAVICCLVGCIAPIDAFGSAIPRVTFVNQPKAAPDLYVSKVLENEAEYLEQKKEDEPLPKFTFVLELGLDEITADGEEYAPIDRQEYTIIQADGTEKADDRGNIITYQTDAGYFELEPGETAWFQELGLETKYRVTEEIPSALQGKFERVLALGESVVKEGVIYRKGASETFTNRFIPDIKTDQATLSITKSILAVDDYPFPLKEDEIFQFTLELNRSPYKNADYIIKDTAGNVTTANTGEKGIVRLPGNCTAVFQIPANGDYRVEEIQLPFGWRAASATVQEGQIHATNDLTFTNTKAAFAVSKKLNGEGDRDKTFTFLLTQGRKGEDSAWSDAEYYLYDTETRQLVYEEPQKTVDGKFGLKPEQMALFINIDKGTFYNVSEQADPDYTQTKPLHTEGYTDYQVSDSVRPLEFENQRVEKQLSVTKLIDSAVAEDVPSETGEFTFVLKKKGKKDDDFTPVPKAVYKKMVGGESTSGQTSDDGKFMIRANETVWFEGLDYNTEYQVEEINLPGDYTIDESDRVQSGELKKDDMLDFTFTNIYVADKLDLQLIKTNKSDTIRIKDASFTLTDENGTEVGTYVTDQDGVIQISGLPSGRYILEETKAPHPYMVMKEPVTIEIIREEADPRRITVSAGSLKASSDQPIDVPAAGQTPADQVTKLQLIQKSGEYSKVEITVFDDFLYTLPDSGGAGIYLYVLAGTLLMMIASGVYMKQRRVRIH